MKAFLYAVKWLAALLFAALVYLAYKDQTGSLALVVVVIPLLLLVYFLPTIIAVRRKHDHRWTIFFVNVFFAETGLGWFLILCWAINGKREPVRQPTTLHAVNS